MDNNYATLDTTKYSVVITGALTGSGLNEIVHKTETKVEAEGYAKNRFGRKWRSRCEVVKNSDLNLPIIPAHTRSRSED